ncbi:MAG: hypothetical protein Kow00107_00700 [Planctomycetota bacterium]
MSKYALTIFVLLLLFVPGSSFAEDETVTLTKKQYEELLQRLDKLEKEIERLKNEQKKLQEEKEKNEQPDKPAEEEAIVLEPPRKFLGLFGEESETVPSLDLSGHICVKFEYSNIEKQGRFTFSSLEVSPRFNLFEELQVGADLDFSEPRPDEDDFYVEQAYIAWAPYSEKQLEVTMGRFNSILGIEAPDPPDNLMASRSFMSEYLVPGDQTGVLIAYSYFDVNLFAAMTNSYGYDGSGERISSDNNSDNTWTVRVEFRPSDDSSVGLNAVVGPEQDNDDKDYRVTLDLDAQFAVKDFFYIGGEMLYGIEEFSEGADASWFGGMLMGNFTFSKMLDVSLRLEYIDDLDGGTRFGKANSYGYGYRVWSSAIALRYHPLTNMDIKLEYRYDGGDEGYYAPETHKSTFSVQVSVKF